MAQPTLPPYLGSWEELIKALLLNPFLGSGGGPFHPHPYQTHSEASEPVPSPWRLGPQPDPWSPTATLLVLAAVFKDIASRLPENQKPVASAFSAVAADWEDGICPPPRPRPHVIVAAVELLGLASTLEEGSLRTSLVREAGTVLEKSFASAGQKPAAVTAIAS